MTKHGDDRIKKLRDDPDFKALVKLLREQDPERVESFIEHMEEPESLKQGKDENDGQ